jgi:hypothetical protein
MGTPQIETLAGMSGLLSQDREFMVIGLTQHVLTEDANPERRRKNDSMEIWQ